jgi:hypothetical protein
MYNLNSFPTKVVLDLTSKKALSKYKLSVTHMRIFGLIAYAHVNKEKRTKLDIERN